MQRMPKHFLRRIAICGKKDYNIDGMRQAAAERRQTTDEKQKMQMLLGHCNCRAGGPAGSGCRCNVLLRRHHTACTEELDDEDLVEYLGGEEHEDAPEE